LICRVIQESPAVVTVEEAALQAGFGSAVLEAANDAGLNTSHVRRLGIPDQFVEHAERDELLADLGLTPEGISEVCRAMVPHAVPGSVRPLSGNLSVARRHA